MYTSNVPPAAVLDLCTAELSVPHVEGQAGMITLHVQVVMVREKWEKKR
jgi:hypothetical protein